MSTLQILRQSRLAIVAVALLFVAARGDETDIAPENGDGAAVATPSTSYTVVTTDNKFSITRMTVPAGQAVTVTVRNDGTAIHNWHLLDVEDASGKPIQSPLLKGGESDSVTFTLTAAGTYRFQCDTHPTEMKGTLVVQ